jgi:hypothetical protein
VSRIFWSQAGFLAMGAVMLGLAVGFSLNLPWATYFWPWPDGRLSFLFIGAVLAGLGSGSLYVAATKAWRAAAGAAVAFIVACGGLFGYLSSMAPERDIPFGFVIAFAVLFALGALMLAESLKYPPVDVRPVPRVVRLSCWVFSAALLVPGLLLLWGSPHIFPWPLKPETSVMFGWMFLGLGSNFGYVAWRGSSTDATVSLIAFLIYDIVLFGPFILHFASVPPGHFTSLLLYTLVLAYSAVLTIVYLLSDRRLRVRFS